MSVKGALPLDNPRQKAVCPLDSPIMGSCCAEDQNSRDG